MSDRELLESMANALERLLRGERPLPLYLFGGSGVGKTHHLLEGAARARQMPGLQVRVVPEDIPTPRDADELWRRLLAPHLPDWRGTAPEAGVEGPTAVFVEGLDRHLAALGPTGQKRLRGLLEAHPAVWIAATGSSLTEALVGREQAFYGWFQVHALVPRDPVGARALVDEVADRAGGDSAWQVTRAAITLLAGGNARGLVKMARSAAAKPAAPLGEVLGDALDGLTGRYRPAFRALPGNEQRLLELLVRVPRALGPTEVANALGGHSSTWSTAAYRLADAGIASIEQEGRHSWYSVVDPLFRHWLDTRLAAPGGSRVMWLCPYLELVLARSAGGRPRVADPLAAVAAVEGRDGQSQSPPNRAEWPALQLDLLALRRQDPEQYGRLRDGLGLEWKALFAEADVLWAQLSSDAWGPLHPELARIDAALGG